MTWRGNPYDGGATTEGPKWETLYCVNHPNTPTTLRCSRCEKPICLRCAGWHPSATAVSTARSWR